MHDPVPRSIPADPPRSIEQLAHYLAAFTNFEQQRELPRERRALGPERCRNLIARACGPPPGLVVQVAGSKGKGSTVLAMERLLRGRGASTVATLSPHLERIEERIRVDGAISTSEEFLGAITALHPALHEIDRSDPDLRPTFFDLITAATVATAVARGSAVLLLEVGLGGPLDSTSAVPPDVQVLTLVDLEHRAQLGETLVEIAAEKARIARPGVPLVIETGGLQEPEAIRAATAVAEERGARVVLVDDDERVPLAIADPRRRALVLSLAALEAAGLDRFAPLEIATADRHLALPGRLEVLPGPPALLLDGAHTIRSVALFARRLAEYRGDRPVTLLVGAMRDKEWRAAIAPLLADSEISWIATSTGGPRSADPTELAEEIARSGREVVALPIAEAIDRLRAAEGSARAVTGSFHLAGAVRAAWSAETPAAESTETEKERNTERGATDR